MPQIYKFSNFYRSGFPDFQKVLFAASRSRSCVGVVLFCENLVCAKHNSPHQKRSSQASGRLPDQRNPQNHGMEAHIHHAETAAKNAQYTAPKNFKNQCSEQYQLYFSSHYGRWLTNQVLTIYAVKTCDQLQPPHTIAQ